MDKADFWHLSAEQNSLVFDYDAAVKYMQSVEWDFQERWLRNELIRLGWTPPDDH